MNEKNAIRHRIARRLKESIEVKEAVAKSQIDKIEATANLIITAYKKGGKLILCGNGGSAADAQHIAAEMVGQFFLKRRAFPAIALTANTSILTAVANDCGYDTVFSRQVEALAQENDVLIGISTSGNSPNVIAALELARSKGIKTIGLSGRNGGKLAALADVSIVVPSSSTPRIQEAHITIGHIICEIVEKELAYTLGK